MFRVVSTEAMEHITAPHSPMLRPTTKTFFDEPLDLGQWTGSNETTMVQIERKSASNAFTLMDWLKSTRSPYVCHFFFLFLGAGGVT